MTADGFRSWLDSRPRTSHEPGTEPTARVVAGVLALVGLGFLAVVRLGMNMPAGPSLSGVYPFALGLGTLAPAVGLLALGVATDRSVHRVALTFAGVFGLLSLLAEPATLPATLAIAAGVLAITGVYLVDHWRAKRFDRWLVAGALAVGAVLSLAAGIGLEPGTLRPLGSRVVLLALAATPVFVDWDREAVLVGLGVGVAVIAMGVNAPFVTGAISLVVGGVVGASLPVLFLGAVGAVILLWASIRSGRTELALAAGVLLVAGVPATIPRGLGVLAAITLLGGVDR